VSVRKDQTSSEVSTAGGGVVARGPGRPRRPRAP
jgi:hypothetical protein